MRYFYVVFMIGTKHDAILMAPTMFYPNLKSLKSQILSFYDINSLYKPITIVNVLEFKNEEDYNQFAK